jgi:Holliday junction DNA helicase RuvA
MIARLEGVLLERDGTTVIVDCNGVGYEVTCSAWTLLALPANGERVILRVFTHAKENDVTLYGFLERNERELFDLLITVKNVGPASAIAILSGGHAPRALVEMIAGEDVAGLNRIKGVGKKTSEMLVVELREKCEALLLAWTADGGLRPSAAPVGQVAAARRRHPLLEEVAGALVGLGWRPVEADKAVAELTIEATSTLEGLLRQALRAMPR